jgi:transcriptional regulator with XRE-family HTH domain
MTTVQPPSEVATGQAAGNGRPRGQRRSELAAFLRARRARIGPADVGLPAGLRRRTPGLRREEVAQLAGVGVTWYTWLEQGRPIHASVQVLGAVARTLRLDQAELEHLYRLAEVQTAPAEAAAAAPSPAVQEILESLDPLPAQLLNSRFDVLGRNRAYTDLIYHRHAVPCQHGNSLWCCFTEPEVRRSFPNFDEEAPRMVATLRASFAQHLNEPEWTSFIRRLSAASPQFAELWARQEVASPASHTKHFLHPTAGLLRLLSTSLAVADLPEARILVYTPADEETRRRLPLTRRR